MNKFFRHISIFILVLIMGCSKKSPAVNIYDSEEYKSLDRKDLIVGESIWSTACFRCHMYGTNGAVLLDNKAYWDKAASKGIDELYKSVWEGKKGDNARDFFQKTLIKPLNEGYRRLNAHRKKIGAKYTIIVTNIPAEFRFF